MTRISTTKSVGPEYWPRRLDAARAYLKSAQEALVLAEDGANMNPAISLMVLAAIAYGDALTGKLAGKVNQQDHRAALRLLRDVLGASLPNAQEAHYRRILDYKDAVQYGVRHTNKTQAERIMADLTAFAGWVEGEL